MIIIIVYYYLTMNSSQVYERQKVETRKENNLSKWQINNKKNLFGFVRLYNNKKHSYHSIYH